LDNYTALTFLMMISLMVMSPGPNGALLLKNVPAYGKKHGYASIVGIVVAFYLHGSLSVFGLSAILVSSANLFYAVKIAGALYLAYLGIKALRSALNQPGVSPQPTEAGPSQSSQRLSISFLEGLLTSLLNPKVSIFYLAAFPQFVDFQSNAALSSYLLVTIHAVFAAFWFSIMVILLGKSAAIAKSPRFHAILQSATGTLLLWFSYRIATEK